MGINRISEEDILKTKIKMSVETALRNIESSMRMEGFEFSEETRAACREILEDGEQADGLRAPDKTSPTNRVARNSSMVGKLMNTSMRQYTRKGK